MSFPTHMKLPLPVGHSCSPFRRAPNHREDSQASTTAASPKYPAIVSMRWRGTAAGCAVRWNGFADTSERAAASTCCSVGSDVGSRIPNRLFVGMLSGRIQRPDQVVRGGVRPQDWTGSDFRTGGDGALPDPLASDLAVEPVQRGLEPTNCASRCRCETASRGPEPWQQSGTSPSMRPRPG